jgi:hypothetical protein
MSGSGFGSGWGVGCRVGDAGSGGRVVSVGGGLMLRRGSGGSEGGLRSGVSEGGLAIGVIGTVRTGMAVRRWTWWCGLHLVFGFLLVWLRAGWVYERGFGESVGDVVGDRYQDLCVDSPLDFDGRICFSCKAVI